MTTELQTDRVGTTQIMTLVGPGTRNTLSSQVYAAGIETLNMAESNEEVRCVVITGGGGHFCSGTDLQQLDQQRRHDVAGQGEQLNAFHQWIDALRSFPKPVIAAVEGLAAGSGAALALACDLLVAAENARFLFGLAQMGLSPDGGASWHLTKALGRGRAMQLLCQEAPVSAQQLAQWGLAQQLASPGMAMEAALAWADQLAQLPAGVLTSVKELSNEAPARSLQQQLDAEKQHFLVNLSHADTGRALERFLQSKV